MGIRTAIVTGITGQDGWYLAGHLIAAGYRVLGTTRAVNQAAGKVLADVELVEWDLQNQDVLAGLLRRTQPAEFYNLAAYTSGSGMFDDPVGLGDINGLSVARILETIRSTSPHTRFCQASSSEMYGDAAVSPLSEDSPFKPLSPYGAAKLYAHEMVGIYRRRYQIFACSAILFSHESPQRRTNFLTRKVSDGVARIKLGMASELILGSLSLRRDWGFSGDYMRGAQLMLQAANPSDYVFATGQTHSIRDLCQLAFSCVDLDYRSYVREDTALMRVIETGPLVGDATRAERQLNWTPEVSFEQLVSDMVRLDLARLGAPTQAMVPQ